MAVVLDSDAVIGFLDRGDALHERAAQRIGGLLVAGEPLLASVITFAEVLTGARLGHHDEGTVRGFFDQLIAEVVPIDLATAERAAELRSRKPALRLPDALILATAALHPDVDAVLGGDRRAARIRGLGVRLEPLGNG